MDSNEVRVYAASERRATISGEITPEAVLDAGRVQVDYFHRALEVTIIDSDGSASQMVIEPDGSTHSLMTVEAPAEPVPGTTYAKSTTADKSHKSMVVSAAAVAVVIGAAGGALFFMDDVPRLNWWSSHSASPTVEDFRVSPYLPGETVFRQKQRAGNERALVARAEAAEAALKKEREQAARKQA
ncbi:hypothetical protein BM477_05545 [Boudabousia marimammalium]|uniref:Uncharacterized protein n=1 Tax=Boudabousia marimammalium TaxID=156892 RepID=A0A1Q5PM92_9ACTO|nr:hypothetical protein BM477_05545 [Boudabousia marimammalium]